MKKLRKFIEIIKPSDKYIYLLTFFSLTSAFITVYWPFLVRNVINDIVNIISSGAGNIQSEMTSFLPYFVLFGVGFVISAAVGTAQTYYQNKQTIMMEKQIRTKAFAHLASLSIDYFDNEQSGKIASKISRGVSRGNNFIQNMSNWALSQIITFIVVIVIFLKLNLTIGILCIVVSTIHVLVSKKMAEMLRVYHGKINKRYDEALGHQVEVFQNIHLVKHYAMETKETSRFMKKFREIYDLTLERGGKRLWYGLVRNILSESLLLSVIVITIYQALQGQMTTGDIFLVATYINYIRWPLWNFSWLYDDAIESFKSIEDIVEMFDQKPTILDTEGAKKLKVTSANIQFKDVSFAYSGKNNVIRKLNLNIPGGSSLALVGPSGVGKSTIIKLLSRLKEPTVGTITIDGQDVTKVTQESLHQSIAVVLQDNILFNDTILNNLTYGASRYTMKGVNRAIKAANLTELVESLPKGLKTVVGERGVKLSGGESQRVSIARALIKNSPIVILDEATSSLDSESEVLVKGALDKLIKGRTTIIIAHRLSTVMNCDQIAVLEKGRITELGNHADLVNHRGIYAKLFEIQSGGYLK